MKIYDFGFLTAVMLLGAIGVNAAQTNLVRLAVIPFSAPPKNNALQLAARELPDILTVDLSNENRFQLVERDKVNAIWSELHLAEDGFVSSETAARLGHILSCDWLVGGYLVQVGTNTQIWIKVVDVHSGVVLDLNTFPFNSTNLSAAASAIPPFLVQVDPQSQPRQFIALGRFANQSLSSSRADWSQRLPAMIEKHFIAAGYGVVEREAIAPIFSEFQFESAGLTGDYTNRVKLKPAFWIVDGGYKWMFDTQEKLSIALRVQKVGSPVQIFRFDEPIGDVESAVVNSVQSALTNSPATNPELASATESAAETDTAMKYAAGHDEFGGGNVATVRNDTLNKLKQAVLLNPKNTRAQYMLGMALFESVDSEEVQQGRQILEEVASSKDPKYATMAKNLLDDFATGRLTIRPGAFGFHEIVPHGQPLSWPTITNLPIAEINAQIAKMNETTNIAARAEPVLQIPPPKSSGYFECITAVKLSHGKVFIACKPMPMHSGPIQLFKYDPATASTVEIPLPQMIMRSINAVEADENHLWLGTDGNGVVETSPSGQLVRAYGESDGFPTTSISSLELENGRLLVGFGGRDSGSIDMETGKFTGQMSEANIFKSGSDMLADFSEPPATGTNSGFMAVLVPNRCVSICKPHGTNWTQVNLSTNFALNDAFCLSLDQSDPNRLWIGNDNGHLTILDMNTSQVIAECHIPDPSWINWILDDGDQMILIVMGYYSNTYHLYCLNKSLLAGHFTPSSESTQTAAVQKPSPEGDDDFPMDFLRLNFAKFVPVQFQKGKNGEAALQRLAVHDNMFRYGNVCFFGFRFTIPARCDGDFQWMYGLAKTEQNQYFASEGTQSGVITEEGGMEDGAFDPARTDTLDHYPHLQQIMPYSHSLQIQTLRRERLTPGKTCAVWFKVREQDYPDLVFAMTINSKHGADAFGSLPLSDRQAAPDPVTTDNPPHSPEQLRSESESALKAKNRAAVLSLFYWPGASDPQSGGTFPPFVYPKEYVYVKVDQMLAQQIGTVTLKELHAFVSTTNVANGFRYRPNIPCAGMLLVEATNRRWTILLDYGKLGNAYYIPVGIEEPVQAAH